MKLYFSACDRRQQHTACQLFHVNLTQPSLSRASVSIKRSRWWRRLLSDPTEPVDGWGVWVGPWSTVCLLAAQFLSNKEEGGSCSAPTCSTYLGCSKQEARARNVNNSPSLLQQSKSCHRQMAWRLALKSASLTLTLLWVYCTSTARKWKYQLTKC